MICTPFLAHITENIWDKLSSSLYCIETAENVPNSNSILTRRISQISNISTYFKKQKHHLECQHLHKYLESFCFQHGKVWTTCCTTWGRKEVVMLWSNLPDVPRECKEPHGSVGWAACQSWREGSRLCQGKGWCKLLPLSNKESTWHWVRVPRVVQLQFSFM